MMDSLCYSKFIFDPNIFVIDLFDKIGKNMALKAHALIINEPLFGQKWNIFSHHLSFIQQYSH